MSSQKVQLRADNGSYVVSRIQNGQEALYADGDENNAKEFDVIITGGWPEQTSPNIELRVGNSYVTLHGDTVVLDETGAVSGRVFSATWRGVGRVALKGTNGKYISRETDGSAKLHANRDKIGSWESFALIEVR